MSKKYRSISELIDQANTALNKPIHQFDVLNRFNQTKGKGKIGVVVEEGVLQRTSSNKNEQAPDIEELGVEVKTCAYIWDKKNKKQVSAKERLSITNINFMEDYKVSFQESHCYSKIEKILFLLYEYEKEILEKNYKITKVFFSNYHDLPEKDRKIIENDYYTIINKIKEGKADELSEGDTMFLGAAPKGKNSKSVTIQPFSDKKAMKRAFVFKNRFMTELFRKIIFQNVKDRESFIKNVEELENYSIEEVIIHKFNKYLGKSISEIEKTFNINYQGKLPKSKLMLITKKILGVNQIENVDEFVKANIVVKTINLEATGKLKESMSFPYVKFEEIFNENDWESSKIYEMYGTQKFLFVVFKKDKSGDIVLRNVKLWNMPIKDLEEVKKVWKRFKEILKGELQIKIKNNKVQNNFPKISENPIAHVRPHANDSSDVDALPESCKIVVLENDFSKNVEFLDTHTFTKQCFWLNSKYIRKILEDE